MNTRDKLLMISLATFIAIISSTAIVNYRAGDAATVQPTESPSNPPIVNNPSPVESAIKFTQLPNKFDANNLNCGFVTSSQSTWESTEVNYQCWTIEPNTCFEDMDCWNCYTMGNKVCGRRWVIESLYGPYGWEIDLQVRYEVEGCEFNC